ncbi:MAG TPA: hypothetical protein PK598_05675 [Thermoanaerobaculia bacterium]|nr:hypothetical protein [Thermoanaerobaculia bacterium]
MRRAHRLLLALLVAWPARGEEPRVSMYRLSDDGLLAVSIVRAERGSGPGATVVFVLEGPRGDRIFLRRSLPEPGVVRHEAWLGRGTPVAFTRRGAEPVLLEAGGRSLRYDEADLPRPTVRCWLVAVVSRVDPKLLEAAAGIRLLREWSGGGDLGDAFYPARVLAGAADPLEARPRGTVRIQEGPFEGEPWSQLSREAVGELGRN